MLGKVGSKGGPIATSSLYLYSSLFKAFFYTKRYKCLEKKKKTDIVMLISLTPGKLDTNIQFLSSKGAFVNKDVTS